MGMAASPRAASFDVTKAVRVLLWVLGTILAVEEDAGMKLLCSELGSSDDNNMWFRSSGILTLSHGFFIFKIPYSYRQDAKCKICNCKMKNNALRKFVIKTNVDKCHYEICYITLR